MGINESKSEVILMKKKEVKCEALLHKMNGRKERVHRESRRGWNLINIAKLLFDFISTQRVPRAHDAFPAISSAEKPLQKRNVS